jgi:hypothetical protein
MRRNLMKKLIIICMVIFSVAGLTRAAPTTLITFDEFPLGTMISDQYSDLGVWFFAGPETGRLPQISMNGAMPTQPILRPTGEPDYYMFKGDFWIAFPTPVTEVQFDSGYWDETGTALIAMFDPYSNLLGFVTNTTTGVETINISGMGKIGAIYFNSISDSAGADIDNLGFTQIPAPGAIVLGGIGAGLIGWLRRRRTL